MNPEDAYSEEKTYKTLDTYRHWLSDNRHIPEQGIEFMVGPKFADYDYEVVINGISDHYIEVKVRNIPINQFETTKVPLRKHSTAEHFYNSGLKATYFVCGFTDCCAILPLWEEPDRESVMLARHDRGDDEDLYAMYKIERFTKIS
jgi:hypothetical protein